MDKSLITQAFEKLGPEKVARGIAADPWAQSFDGCFLALAYGPRGELLALCDAAEKAETSDEMNPWNREALRLLGLDAAEMSAVWRAWDREGGAFRALAREWLEAHPSRVLRARRALSGVQELGRVET